MKRTTLAHKKQIISKRGYATNVNEYRKGYERGAQDATNRLGFGRSCAKITMSYCVGYKLGWRKVEPPARYKNLIKTLEFEDEGEE